MKKIFAISVLIISASISTGNRTYAQSSDQPPADATTALNDTRHNWGWLGLLGLVGLAGLRRPKSEFERRMASRGVKVGSV